MSKSIIAIIAALWLICPGYAESRTAPEDYVQIIVKSTATGSNREKNLFDSVLLKYWDNLNNKKKCFTLPGLDTELTGAQDSDAHDIRVNKLEMTEIGPKIRAIYTVFGKKYDKDFYLVEQNKFFKIHDVCDHPSKLGDKCYQSILEKGECAE